MEGISRKIGNFEVIITRGDITDQKVDVIVNSCNSKLDFSIGQLSRAILARAGDSVQEECKKTQYESGLSHGQIAVTGPGRLVCKKIYHVYLSWWTWYRKEAVTSAVCKCLQEASDMEYKSIAIPALGTGLLGYSLLSVTTGMLDAVKQFKATNPSSSVTEIRIVVYPADKKVYAAFVEAARDIGHWNTYNENKQPVGEEGNNQATALPDNVAAKYSSVGQPK